VNLVNREGGLRQGDNEVMIEFRDRNGQLVDVGNVKFDMDMNMAEMQMHSGGSIERTNNTWPVIGAKSRSTCPAIGTRRLLSTGRRGMAKRTILNKRTLTKAYSSKWLQQQSTHHGQLDHTILRRKLCVTHY